MRHAWLCGAVAAGLVTGALAQEPPPADAQARLIAKIRRFIQASGQAAVAKQACDQMLEQFSEMPGIPREFIERFKKEAKAEDLANLAVPIFARYLSEADVDALIAFHESPFGKRFAALQPKIMKETMEAGEKWGAELGERVMREVMAGGGGPGAGHEGDPEPRSRISVNEANAILSLRSLTTAQEQFRTQCQVDQDGDGAGEYGWLGELAGIDTIRVLDLKASTAPFIAAILGVKDANGCSQKSGYFYRLYLPTARGKAAAESASGTPEAVMRDADEQEVRWVCYAWPVTPGMSGQRSFMANNAGEVYETDGEKTPYGGTDRVPAAAAAYDPEGPNPPNLDSGIGLAAAGLRAVDGNVWRPAAERRRPSAATKSTAGGDVIERPDGDRTAQAAAWKIALETVLPDLQRFMESENHMKHCFATFGVEIDRPEYYFTIRPPFRTDPRADTEAAINRLWDKLMELHSAGFARARARGFPRHGVPIVHFMDAVPEGKKAKDGTEVATSDGTSTVWK